MTRVAEGLKELALHGNIAVLAIAAADREGLGTPRLRLHHLRGSTSLAYEADLAILLNDKHRIVSKMHLTYDAGEGRGLPQHRRLLAGEVPGRAGQPGPRVPEGICFVPLQSRGRPRLRPTDRRTARPGLTGDAALEAAGLFSLVIAWGSFVGHLGGEDDHTFTTP